MKTETHSLNESLLSAAQNKQWEAVEQALAAGADVNAQDAYGDTVLYYACIYNAPLALVRLMLESGADLRVQEASILCSAVSDFNFELLELLLSFGANINATNRWTENPLREAVKMDIYPESADDKEDELYVQMIELLLKAGATLPLKTDSLRKPIKASEHYLLDLVGNYLHNSLIDICDGYEDYCSMHGNAPKASAEDLQEKFYSDYYRYLAYERAYALLRNAFPNTSHNAKRVLDVCDSLKSKVRHVLRAFM